MPYVKQEDRGKEGGNAGILNYQITTLVDRHLQSNSHLHHDNRPHYCCLNEVVGVLECVKQELYRRVIAPYEDVKREKNGDVFTVT